MKTSERLKNGEEEEEKKAKRENNSLTGLNNFVPKKVLMLKT